jgi:putative membrane protein
MMNETRGVAKPPAALDKRREKMVEHLKTAPDEQFDETYLDQQVLAHQETVSLMTSYRDGGDNPQLRSLAAAAAPVVERHLTMMKAMRAELA